LQGAREHGQEAARAAVQSVLYQQLYRQFNDMDHFHTDTKTILEEAAYQLQLRLQGPKVFDICCCAIGVTLIQLRADLEGNYSRVISGPADPHSFNPEPAE
jgi:hypothetical protein